MNWEIVERIIIEPSVRRICFRPYPNHKKGCPNYDKKPGCPPQAPLIEKILDIDQPIWAIWNIFDFRQHCEKMKKKHPNWSERQIQCCLYWQGTARKALKGIISDFSIEHWGLKVITCPEACGVNVTNTMRRIGHILEWPPKTKTYQIVLAGKALLQ